MHWSGTSIYWYIKFAIIRFLAHPKVDIDQIPKEKNIACKLTNNWQTDRCRD